MNALHVMILDSMQYGEQEKYDEVARLLDWPPDPLSPEDELAQSDREAREAMMALGLDPVALLGARETPA